MQVFTKTNSSRFEDALVMEVDGLEQLRAAIDPQLVRIPQVLSVNHQKLELTAIDSGSCSTQQMRMLGEGLARIHRRSKNYYGYHCDNFIGLNPQKNGRSQQWGRFFIDYRLKPQIAWINNESIKASFNTILEHNDKRLMEFLTENCRFPSLVHGDLWSGNYLCDAEVVWLIDPAVYYADREVDIAMTEMFGGFADAFYQAYDAVLPRSPVYDSKKPIYNLYHYLNHLNLFGESYIAGCEAGFETIEKL